MACIALLGSLAPKALAQDDSAPQELLQGPLHEAFGQPVVFNPQPGIIVAKRPPDPVNEMPPDQKPEGDNVVWISGYWSWDDQRMDFIWVSGFWRTVPAGRTWVAGYWGPSGDKFQWVSGFWAPTDASAHEYLPQPPASLETGPSTQPPTADSLWTPGCWVWRDARFAWRPGTWYVGQADWVWVPAHYAWTPSGYVFIEGYWDYAIQRRGLLFAPCLFPQVLIARPQFVFTPGVVVDLGLLSVNLFIRPALHHYYFGDYYAADYVKLGIFPWFSYHNSHVGFDPLFAHASWVHRTDEHWLPGLKQQFWDRRDHVELRPAHTFAAMQAIARQPNAPRGVVLAHSLTEVARSKTSTVRLQQVPADRLKEYHAYAKETHVVTQQRAQFEAKTPPPAAKAIESKPPARFDVKRETKTSINVTTAKDKGPPKLPTLPAHHVDPPKVVHPALPHPEENLKRPPKK